MNIVKLQQISPKTRFIDAPNELRIRLKRSIDIGDVFFHEGTLKDNQMITATLSKDKETLDISLFAGKEWD